MSEYTAEQVAAFDALDAAIKQVRRVCYANGDNRFVVEWIVVTASLLIDQDDVTHYGYIVPQHSVPYHHLEGLLHRGLGLLSDPD